MIPMAVSVVNFGSASRREGTRTDDGEQCGTNFAYLNIRLASSVRIIAIGYLPYHQS
jgi:hypothetical protein